MGCCNGPSATLAASVQNPALHVNYAKGMVLGVDDFMQEFAYLAGRDNWMVAELVGYGTTSGLAVTVEDTADGPRVRVTRGAAAAPSGKLICVPADQCGVLNKWLAKKDNASKIDHLLLGSPPQSPPNTPVNISLWLTLCYADCKTALVPIPGEPCRSDDDLMAPSRVADDYKLELRTEAPAQTEEDAIRDFVSWLRHVPIVDSGEPLADEAAWIVGLKAAAQPWFDVMNASPQPSPPASLSDYMFGSPGLSIGRDQLCAFLRVAFRFWVTDLRPLWMTRMCGNLGKPDDDCVLLAQLDVSIVWVGGSPSGAWQVDGTAAGIAIDESGRPIQAHARLLQEWLLCGCACSGQGSSPTFASLTTTGAEQIGYLETDQNIALDATHHVVVGTAASGQQITLPAALSAKGRVYVVKVMNKATLQCTAGDAIEGPTAALSGPAATVGAKNALTVVSNGQKSWHVIATVV